MRMKHIWTGLALLLFASLAQAQGGITRSLTATSGAAVACPSSGCLIQQLDGYGAWAVQVTNTFVGTVQFEQSNGGMSADQTTWTWVSLPMTPSAGGAAVTSATAPGVWAGRLGGIRWVRVRVSAYTSGTIDVQTGPSPATIGYIPPFDGNAAHFLDGTGAFSASSGGTPGGADKTIQYNNAGSFGGVALNATATPMYLEQTSSGTPVLHQPASTELSDVAALAVVAGKLSQFAATTSAELAGVLSDETGSGGGFVRATSPTLTTPALGTPSAAVLTNATGLPEGGLSLTDITTANASTSAHGFVKKLSNVSTQYFDGTGNFSTPAGSGTQPSVSAFNSATQSIANNTIVALTLNSEDYDNNSMHSTSSNTSRLVVPAAQGGVYMFTCSTTFPASATLTAWYVYMYVNGTRVRYQGTTIATGSNLAEYVSASWIYTLAAADYAECEASQVSGGSLSVGDTTTEVPSRATLTKLSN